SCVTVKTPELLVVTLRVRLVAGLETSTLASVIGAPALSLTVPVIEPLVLCPSPIVAANNTSARAEINRFERNRVIISTSLVVLESPVFDRRPCRPTDERGRLPQVNPRKAISSNLPRWRRT